MNTSSTNQPPPSDHALGTYAAANAALATDVQTGFLDRYLETLARLTGCDLILIYEGVGSDGSLALVGQSGLPRDRLQQLQILPSADRHDSTSMPSGRPIPALAQLGVRTQLSYPLGGRGWSSGELIFCSKRWDRFDQEVLSVFSATSFEVDRVLRRQRDSSADSPEAESNAANMQQQFIAVLAHELRNPIAPIRSGLDLMATDLLDSEGRRSTLAMMQRQLNHLVRLVDDLLDTVRLRTGQLQVKREPVLLREVVRSAIECIRPALFAKHQALKLDDDESDIVLDIDPVRLSQAFVNVLSANVKQTPEGGVISIAVSSSPEQVHVTFEDEAPDIDTAGLGRVFDLFPEQAHKHSDVGLGIGLALVRGLVELNDGTVAARPRGEQPGASYVITLPVPAAPLTEQAASPAAIRPPWPSQRILIVDDNIDAANTLGLLFELDGATIRIAHDGPSAVDEAQQFAPEVILLDIGIPGFGGNEAARRIRAMTPPVRPLLIALTGWGAKEDRAATAASGFDLHLVKPITHRELVTQIHALMNEQQNTHGPR